ncbi:hypothetical protein [Chryseobacterium gregarium]|uniref:hypothetical protein n=1 Tax=Chryseobacterium gregarium TaxID=456299 RepID=UPI0004090C19|nr:hypothetical protein [Chryseobacterium gregarium]
MRKLTKIILWVSIGIFAIIFLPDVSIYYERIKLSFDKLPNIYRSYTTIDSIKDNQYEVVGFLSDYPEPILQVNDTTIVVFCGHSKETKDGSRTEKNVWYKINLKGQITDSLKYQYNDSKENHFYRNYHGFIVDIKNNTYNTWLTNSDTTNRCFKNLNENKIFTVKEAAQITKEREFMNAERISSDGDSKPAKYKLTVYKNNVWNYFYTDKDWYGSDSYSTNSLAVEYLASNDESDKDQGLIKRVFVKKEEWISRSFWHLDFGWGGGYTGDRWEGTSYFEIAMPKRKLHFKQPVEVTSPDEDFRDRFTYKVYKPKNGIYLILNDVENSRYYLIRPKRK